MRMRLSGIVGAKYPTLMRWAAPTTSIAM
jgi:hypothetical protein